MLSLLLVLACVETADVTPTPKENVEQGASVNTSGAAGGGNAGQVAGSPQNQGGSGAVGVGGPAGGDGQNLGNPNGGENIGPAILPENGENIGDPGPPPEGGGQITNFGPPPTEELRQQGTMVGQQPSTQDGAAMGQGQQAPQDGAAMGQQDGGAPDQQLAGGEQMGGVVEPQKLPPTFIYNAQSVDSGPLYKAEDGSCFVRTNWDQPPNGSLGDIEARDCPQQMEGDHWKQCVAGRLVKHNVGDRQGTCQCEPVEGEPSDVNCPKSNRRE